MERGSVKLDVKTFLVDHEQDIVKSFSELIKIPGIAEKAIDYETNPVPYGPSAYKALDYCRKMLSDWGFEVKEYNNHCIKISIRGEKESEILFAAHCDVVHPDDDCIYDPFLGEVVGDYMIGRGSIDDKGPLIAMAYVFKFLKENNFKPKNTFSLFIGSNEEGGMSDLDYYLKKEKQPLLGISVDDDFPVVKGEASRLTFTVAAKKNSGLKEILEEKDLRRATPNVCEVVLGDDKIRTVWDRTETNALIYLLEELDKKGLSIYDDEKYQDFLYRMFKKVEDPLDEVSVKLTDLKIEGDNVEAKLLFNVPPSVKKETVEDYVLRVEEKYQVELKLVNENLGYCLADDEPIVKLLTDVYNKNSGTDYKPYVMVGATYARKFERGLGFGAGNPAEVKPFPKGHGSAHGPDEAHRIDVLLHAIEIYAKAAYEIDNFY